jgi:hypothetical protein
MSLKISELVSIVLAVLVTGMFFGPWVALTISIRTFKAEVLLAIVGRMNRNMGAVMTVLMPVALLSIVPVLVLSFRGSAATFYLNLSGLVLFVIALLVTVLVEVPIVEQIVPWTPATLPEDWERLRDRWGRFHIVRVAASLCGLVLLLVAAIF